MCLAIPSKVIKIENGIGTIDADGVKRTCSLLLVDDVKVGDYVIVHAGFALRKVDEVAAAETINFLKEAAAAVESTAKKDSD